jgi:hypothetical protein
MQGRVAARPPSRNPLGPFYFPLVRRLPVSPYVRASLRNNCFGAPHSADDHVAVALAAAHSLRRFMRGSDRFWENNLGAFNRDNSYD